MLNNQQLNQRIFARFKQTSPQPTTELIYQSNFELLIAVILSAQSTDVQVNKVTKKLFTVANTPQKLADLGVAKLEEYLRTLGLYKNKAKNVIKCCQQLINEYNCEVPASRDELQKLAGVGRKTANVILNTVFGEAVIAVDTHVYRVAKRIGLANDEDNFKQVEEQLMHNVPRQYLGNAHHWLILHGRYFCKARKPLCKTCLINDLCPYPQKTFD